MPTIRDVAKHAGVSIATVSRVINESGFVSEELRSVVLKAMQDLHFQPSALAKGLKTPFPRLSALPVSRRATGL